MFLQYLGTDWGFLEKKALIESKVGTSGVQILGVVFL